MAILWDSYVSPADLTTFARQVPLRQDMVLNRILPDRVVDTLEVNVDETTTTLRTAHYRAWDAPPQPGLRDGFTTRSVKLPAVSQFLSKGEKERLEIEKQRSGGGATGAIVNAIYDDAERNVRSVQARVELARGDLLQDGVVTINELGGIAADFGVPGTNIVTAGTLWTDLVNSDPLTNLQAWVKVYRTANGFAPGGFIASEDVVYNMLQNAKIRALYNSSVGTPSVLGMDSLDAALRNYRLPPISFTYDSQVEVDGTITSILPNNKVIFLPPAGVELGYTAWGITATGLELANASALPTPAGMVAVVDKDVQPPYREAVYVDATALPVLSTPKALFVATVG